MVSQLDLMFLPHTMYLCYSSYMEIGKCPSPRPGGRTMAIILSNAGFSDERLVGTLCAGQLIVNGVSLPLDAISTIAAIYTIKWIA